MKCKPYSEITVEIRTQLKTVKITSNIFAVYLNQGGQILPTIAEVAAKNFPWLRPCYKHAMLTVIF